MLLCYYSGGVAAAAADSECYAIFIDKVHDGVHTTKHTVAHPQRTSIRNIYMLCEFTNKLTYTHSTHHSMQMLCGVLALVV